MKTGVWGKSALLILLATILTGCTPREPVPFQDAAWSTKGEPIVMQKLGAWMPDAGLYRYVDKETSVVVYLYVTSAGNALTSQKYAGTK